MAAFKTGGKKVGVIGATGAVGVEVVSCLANEACKFEVSELHLYASARSAGKKVETPFGEIEIELFSVEAARTCDFVFMAVSGDFALEHARNIAEGDGPYVIDNSSAFRYMEDVPLVVPEINASAMQGAKLIANPNCTTAIAAVALWPLHLKYGIKKMIMSTYQAASGAGAEGMEELTIGSAAVLKGEKYEIKAFAHQLPFNLIPHIDKFQPNAYTKEEMKVAWETRKIFGISEADKAKLAISCTAVRVPVLRAHSEAITIETERPVDLAQARAILASAPGCKVVDNVADPAGPGANPYPMPMNASGQYDVEVGRIRESLVFGECGMDLFVSGDQLLRGAALNAVLIAEKIVNC